MGSGQVRPVHVYRLLAAGTMEEKIYSRQIAKQSLAARVVDEHQVLSPSTRLLSV
jgi:SNF2 family DNA or RNA helicase